MVKPNLWNLRRDRSVDLTRMLGDQELAAIEKPHMEPELNHLDFDPPCPADGARLTKLHQESECRHPNAFLAEVPLQLAKMRAGRRVLQRQCPVLLNRQSQCRAD